MNCTRYLFSIALAIALLLCGTAALADNVLTLPAGLKTIEEEAFYGDTSIDSVTLPQGILEIRARAFANSSLRTINLPDSLTFIADDAFDGPDYVRVTVNPDTYAYTWADRMGYLLLAPTQNASRGHINKVILSWNAIEDADSYNVYYGISENIAEASEITGIEETSYTITGLLSGTTYYTWVKAVYSNRVSPASNMESAITYPDVPTLENPMVSGNSIALSWNAVIGATTYRIYYNTENDYSTATLVDKIRNTSYTLADLDYDTIYYIWIASANTSGGLRTTTPKIVSTEADSFAPIQKASKGLRNKVTVSWEPVETADSYNVYYSTSDSISEATEITGITETSYDIENLLSGTMYYTWVKAVNTERVSSASNMKNVITYPDAPILNDPEVSGNSISLNWNAVTGAALYRIYYNTTTDVNTATTIDITQDTAYTVNNLEYSTTYYFWMASINSSGGLRTISPKTATTDLDPSAPVQNASEGQKNAVIVNWTALENANSYNVYFGVTANISEATEITGIAGTSYTIENLLSGTVYYTWVKAVIADGVTPASNRKSVITWPDAPTLKSLTASGNSLSMTWDEVVGATVYRIRYSAADDYNSATLIDNIRTTAYTIENLEYGREYSIWISSVNSSGGQRTKYKKITCPAAPTLNDPVVSGNSITLSWNEVTGATIYRLYYSTTEVYSTSTAIKIDNITSTSYTLENLEYNTTYYIWIGSANSSGGVRTANPKTAITDPDPDAPTT